MTETTTKPMGIKGEPKFGGFAATDGSGLFFRELPPSDAPVTGGWLVQAIRAGASGVNVDTEFETIDLHRLEHVRSVRCVDHRFRSNAVYTIYLHHPLYGSPAVVVAENHGGANHRFYLVEQLDAMRAYLAIATVLQEGDLWTLLASLTDSVDGGKQRGRVEVMRAFREGRLVWQGRGSKRRAVLVDKSATA